MSTTTLIKSLVLAYAKSGYLNAISSCRYIIGIKGNPSDLSRFALHAPLPILHLRSLLSIYRVDEMIAIGLPWWTYRATAFVEKFLSVRNGHSQVFEYGSGASTFWLSSRCQSIHTVEHDQAYFHQIKSLAKDLKNVTWNLVTPKPIIGSLSDGKCLSARKGFEMLDFTDYVQSIANTPILYDLIVIDGRARSSCLKFSMNFLKPNGIIVFDNTFRQRYHHAISQSRLTCKKFTGLAPSLLYPEQTSILYS